MISPTVISAGVVTALNFAMNLAGRVLKNQKNDSLIHFTKATRVEPITLVDERLKAVPYTSDVLQSMSSLFIGYYLQAVSLAVNVGRVNVLKLLDSLNPSRDVYDAAGTRLVSDVHSNENLLSMENYRFGLPVPGESYGLESFNISNEAFGDLHGQSLSNTVDAFSKNKLPEFDHEVTDKDGKTKVQAGQVSVGDQVYKDQHQAINLSVGKLINVTVKDGNAEAEFPISVRLIVTLVGSSILSHILGEGDKNASWKERFHSWRAGQLEFWRDLVLANDLIDEHRKVLQKDKSGAYEEMLNRRSGNAFASGLSGTPSIGTASNLVVLSKETAEELERATHGRLSDPKFRQRLFERSYVMILAVVDHTHHELVTFYHRGINLPTVLSVRELKAANKGTGPDVAEILRAYQLSQTPAL